MNLDDLKVGDSLPKAGSIVTWGGQDFDVKDSDNPERVMLVSPRKPQGIFAAVKTAMIKFNGLEKQIIFQS